MCNFYLFIFLRVAGVAYEGSQARDRIRAAAGAYTTATLDPQVASENYSAAYSNARSLTYR